MKRVLRERYKTMTSCHTGPDTRRPVEPTGDRLVDEHTEWQP